MLSKSFMHYLVRSEKQNKDKNKEYSSDITTKPLFYIILKNSCEDKKA